MDEGGQEDEQFERLHLSDGGGQMTAARADIHCQWVWVTINRLIAKTKQAAMAVLMSSGIQAEERLWNEAEFSIHRRQSGKIE